MTKKHEFLCHELALTGLRDQLVPLQEINDVFQIPPIVPLSVGVDNDAGKLDDHAFTNQELEGLVNEHKKDGSGIRHTKV